MTEYGKTLVEAAYKAHRNFRGNGGLDDVLGPKLTDKTRAALLAFLDKLHADGANGYPSALLDAVATATDDGATAEAAIDAFVKALRSEIAEESGR